VPDDVADMVGVATVRADGETYVPEDKGPILALVIGVYPDDELIDLIAVDSLRPQRWRPRVGVADVLGEANLRAAFGLPLLVHRDPLLWLRASGEGICVLQYTSSLCAQLRYAHSGLVANPTEFGVELDERLTVPKQRAQILVSRKAAA